MTSVSTTQAYDLASRVTVLVATQHPGNIAGSS